MDKVIVIGSGVSGLSSALNLQLAGFDVRIITAELPLSTTSIAAGAIWYGGGATGRVRQWAQGSLSHFLKLANEADSGVTLQRIREFLSHPLPDPWFKDQLPFCERIPEKELPAGSQAGFLMDLPTVAPPRYLENLQQQFIAAGGVIELRSVQSLMDLADEAPLLVNCSGVGARQLANDQAVYPIRGQTLLIDAPQITEGYMNDSVVTYLFPRGDGVLIGGLVAPDDWNREIDADVTADIIARCSEIAPTVATATIKRQFAGLRPGRHQVRLELERLSPDCTVIHNYGHAAIGYTLSWGCAQEVLALARGLATG